jgi:hypothetical protein
MSTIIVRRAQLADADTIAAFNRALAEETEGRRLDPAIVASGVRRLLAGRRWECTTSPSATGVSWGNF